MSNKVIFNRIHVFQLLLLAIGVQMILCLAPGQAAPVFQCLTNEGNVIFTDSPAQLQACQELTLSQNEEEGRNKNSALYSIGQARGETRLARYMPRVENEYTSASSRDFDGEEDFEEDM